LRKNKNIIITIIISDSDSNSNSNYNIIFSVTNCYFVSLPVGAVSPSEHRTGQGRRHLRRLHERPTQDSGRHGDERVPGAHEHGCECFVSRE